MCFGLDVRMIESRSVLVVWPRLNLRCMTCCKDRHVQVRLNINDVYRISIGFENELFLSI